MIDIDEFSELIGREVSEDEWVKAMDWYTHTTMDKVQFAEAYSKGSDKIVGDMCAQLNQLEVIGNEAYNRVHKFAQSILALANDSTVNPSMLRARVREFIGMQDYVTMCLESGYKLHRVDRDYILSHMKDEE